MQQKQNTNSQPMNCKNEEHFEQQFVFFKFSEKIGEILQCMSCNSEDPQVNKKIIIDQIFKLPSSKIQNFPPLKNQKNSKQIQKIMENFTKEKIKQYIEYVNNQIDSYYQKINQDITQVLLQSKKDVLQQFEDILEFTNVSEFYDIAPVKEMIEKYQKNDIDLKQMFEQQLKMKKNFEDEKKFNIAINQEKIQNEVQNQIQNLKVQLDEKIGIYKKRIVINTEAIKKYKLEIQDVQQEIPQQNPGNQQDKNQQLEKNMYCQQQFRENEVDNRRKIIQQQNKQEDKNFIAKQSRSFNELQYRNYYHQKYDKSQQIQHERQSQSRNQNYNNRIQYLDKNGGINNDIQAQQQKNNKVLPENQSNKFETIKQIQDNLHTFINLDKNKQFQHLGLLMFPKVKAELEKQEKIADPAGMAQKITSMMVDLTVFEVSEIIEFFESQAEFQDRLQEAIELINQQSLN